MSTRRYKQSCALAHSADLIGERWTLLIIRELLLRPRRYGELLSHLGGMGTNLLAKRLKDLTEAGLLDNRGATYQLTAAGSALEPAVLALIRWGLVYAGPAKSEEETAVQVWDLLALKAHFCPERAPEQPETLYFERDDLRAAVRVSRRNGFELEFVAAAPKGAVSWHGKVGDLVDIDEVSGSTSTGQRSSLGRFLGAFDVD